MSDFHVIIPARYASTRLPGKPLRLIGGTPMVVHVCKQAAKSGATSVVVATDNDEIMETVKSAGFDAVITDPNHQSGSDRIFEAAQQMGLGETDIVVNVQGDEPFIPSSNISQVASLLQSKDDNMSTLCCEITDAEEVLNPNAVKVIFDNHMKAIYFSRAVIPWNRDHEITAGQPLPGKYYRHIGIYGYRFSFLEKYVQMPASHLETTECLEQLRVLENGYSIKVAVLDQAPPAGIDTQQDLTNANQYYAEVNCQ